MSILISNTCLAYDLQVSIVNQVQFLILFSDFCHSNYLPFIFNNGSLWKQEETNTKGLQKCTEHLLSCSIGKKKKPNKLILQARDMKHFNQRELQYSTKGYSFFSLIKHIPY